MSNEISLCDHVFELSNETGTLLESRDIGPHSYTSIKYECIKCGYRVDNDPWSNNGSVQ